MTRGPGRLAALGWVPFAWYSLLLLGPLLLVLATSFATRGQYGVINWGLGAGNYLRAIDPIYSSIVLRSFILALATSLLCFVIGLPMALTMATSSGRARSVFVLVMAIPFLTNLTIRICALKAFVGYDGPLAWILTAMGFEVDRFALSQNMPLVMYGMISSYLPFMVFPLFAALERFDFSLVEAAVDLGAKYRQVLGRIIIPALKRPIISGWLLVFIPAFGEFIIPDLLGGARSMLIGNLISDQFLKSRDWPFGSALSVILMLGLVVTIIAVRKFERPLK